MASLFNRSRLAQFTWYNRFELICYALDLPVFVQILISQNFLLLAIRKQESMTQNICVYIFSFVQVYSKSEPFSSNNSLTYSYFDKRQQIKWRVKTLGTFIDFPAQLFYSSIIKPPYYNTFNVMKSSLQSSLEKRIAATCYNFQ